MQPSDERSLNEQFQSMWRQAEDAFPDIVAFLSSHREASQREIADVVLIDQHFRWHRNMDPRNAEFYLERFPTLAANQEQKLELVQEEINYWTQFGRPIVPEDFKFRFPELDPAELFPDADAAQSEDRPPPRNFALHLNCPHCRNPIEIVAEESSEELVCPSCGSTFRLNAQKTLSRVPGKLPKLGQFELFESVGNGAFGAVYRARDTQLQRIVAVKVPRNGQLPTAEADDFFVREARNAAQLQHPGIVPVFEVGRSEAFPYIVSEFVEGLTLADVLKGRRFTFRESAELVSHVAIALQHAHHQGVIHRDLKPSNIMITPSGAPRLMDFGMAKRDVGEITVTLDGQVLGTPAYMSPEQAAGRSHHVDGRSDVYSAGVILYELLTGERPFRGNQRMLLHQVMHDEPRTPRVLNDRIPRDLDTIAIKCLEKEPAKRYASAQALADDLQRWLAGKPILARPIGRVARCWRWCRRNAVLAAFAGALVAALLAGTLISTYFAIRSGRFARDAIAESERADANASEAAARAQEAVAERDKAAASFQQARDAVNDSFAAISENQLLNVPGLQPLRKQLLQASLKYYEAFVREHAADLALQRDLARTHLRIGNIRDHTGEPGAAEQSFRQAITIFETLLREHPSEASYQNDLAAAFKSLGDLQDDTGRETEAESSLERALEIWQQLAGENPGVAKYKIRLAQTLSSLAELQRVTGRNAAAEATIQQAIQIWERLAQVEPTDAFCQSELARILNIQSIVQYALERHAEAKASCQRAVEIRKKLAEDYPTAQDYQSDLATSLIYFGVLQNGTNDKAEASFRAAIDVLEKLVRENPAVLGYQGRLAIVVGNLGGLLDTSGRNEEAEAAYRRAIEITRNCAQINPTVTEYQGQLAQSFNNLAVLQQKTNQVVEAKASYQQAIKTLETLAKSNPTVPRYRNDLATTYGNLANLQRITGDAVDADANYQRAIDLFGRLASEYPKEGSYRIKLLNYQAGRALLKLSRPAKPEVEKQQPNSNESKNE